MKELLLRNLLILYLGVSLRFLFYKIIKRRDVDFQRLLHGIKCPKNKMMKFSIIKMISRIDYMLSYL